MPTAPDSLRKKIQQLQTRLTAIEAQQTAARRGALTFLRQTITELGLSAADVTEALRGGTATTGRKGTRRGRPTKAGKAGKAAAAPKAGTRAGRPGKRKAGAAKRAARGAAKGGAAKGRAGGKVPAKYRGPEGETWSGRGKQPRWLAALVATGRTPAEFLIAT